MMTREYYYNMIRKLRLYWLMNLLLSNKEFFIDSEFCIVANIHCGAQEGIGTYLLHKDLWKYFEHTDDHSLRYPTMLDCYNMLDELKDIEFKDSDLNQLLEPRWQLIIDRTTEKVVGLMGEHESNRICRDDGSHDINYDFDKLSSGRGELEKSRYYIDQVNPLFIKGVQMYQARYYNIPIKLNEVMDYLLIG